MIPNKSITLKKLTEMFEDISKNTDWDMKSPMLWGYFFTHHEAHPLEKVKKLLEVKGYTFVDLYLAEKENEQEEDVFFLHIEKIETHTPNSLDERNNQFYILADEHGLDSYDGMDVGPVDN